MNPAPNQSLLQVSATARPIRLAILVDPDRISISDLDNLTYECATFWGGGFWPIVPTDGAHLGDDWWGALKAIDPDVIYAHCPVSDDLYDDLQRRLAPSAFMHHTLGETSAPGAHVGLNGLNLQAIGAYEVAPYHAQMSAVRPVEFLDLRDTAEPAPFRAFALRNFGVLRWSFQAQRTLERLPREEALVTGVTIGNLLSWTSAAPGARVVPRDLSRLYASRAYDLDADSFSEGFQLIVGDSIDEILYTWNRSLTSRGFAGRDALWLDTKHATDAPTMRMVATWITQAFWANNGQRPISVVSYSADFELLRYVAESIRDVARVRCEVVQLVRGQFRFRATPRLTRGRPLYASEEGVRRTELVPMSDGNGLLTVARPPFAAVDISHDGWMIDLDIEYSMDEPRHTGQTDSWHLPHRAQLGHLFASNRVHARINAQGQPSVSVMRAERAIAVTVPAKWRLLDELLSIPHPPISDRDESWRNHRHLYETDISEQGRRFQSVVNLFGGIQQLGFALDDGFWRMVFLQLAGRPQEHRILQNEVIERELRDAMTAGTFDGEEEQRSSKLADLASTIASALHPLRAGRLTIDSKWLRSQHGPWRARETRDHGHPPVDFEEGALPILESLVESGVLLQGFMVKCPVCSLDVWRTVDGFTRRIRCDGCTTEFSCPLEPNSQFRLNQLIVNALARDGVMPLLHIAMDFTRGVRHMATVFPPTELRRPGEDALLTDLDIIALRDGKLLLGEVKSSPGQFNEKQLAKLETVARAVRPDAVWLVAVGETWSPETLQQIDRLRATLTPFDVTVESRLLDW